MSRLMMRAALVCVACLLCRAAAAGCTLGIPPLKSFNEAEYVFTARVMNVAGPLTSSGWEGEAWGLLVSVEDAVHLPEASAAFEVYPLKLGSDCNDYPWKSEELLKDYPLGSEVRVVARRAKSPEGAARLVIRLADDAHLSHNTAEGGGEVTTAASVYDYRKLRRNPDERLAGAYYELLPFELRKELLRLKRAADEAERVAVLERLVDFPSEFGLDFAGVAKEHVKNKAARKRLLRRREARFPTS